MTRPTLHSAAAASRPPRGWRRLYAAGLRAVVGLALVAAFAGCSGGGSGEASGGGGGGDEVLATEPVDLPPGQTAARVAWTPSRGRVGGYYVLVSRNGGNFAFFALEQQASTVVEGQAGDEIRVIVMALNDETNTLSEPSPPSVPIRFYAAAASVASASRASSAPIAREASLLPEAPPGEPIADPPPASPAETPSAPEPAPAAEPPPSDSTPPVDASDEPSSALTSDLRLRLLLADVRMPLDEPGAEAAGWLQGWLADSSLSDLVPIGTSLRPEDGRRDLIWRDPAGQLSWSDGVSLAAWAPETWPASPTLALGPEERWIDLVDLDGDAVRDWVVEHRGTGEVYYRVDAQAPAFSARAADQPASDRLVASGDFDGDGAAELLWEDLDGALLLARPSGSLPPFAAGAFPPPGAHVLAVADLTGDGRDDLIARHEDGRIGYGIVVGVGGTDAIAISWSGLSFEAAAGAELVATLDEDGDGRAALVWYEGGSVEIRGPGETVPRPF